MIGRKHALARRVRALRRDGELRRREGVFLAEGIKLAGEALDSGARLERVLATAEWIESVEAQALLRRFEEAGVPCDAVEDEAFASLQDARSPQPITLLAQRVEITVEQALDPCRGPALAVVVIGVQDPGNFGTILRTAEALGATALLAVSGVDPWHPRAVRASAGSIFRLTPCIVDADVALASLAAQAIQRVGAAPRGSVPPEAVDLVRPSALCFGGESTGLEVRLMCALDVTVGVPMRADVDSLSVGAAAAILLYEAARQRRAPVKRASSDRRPSDE